MSARMTSARRVAELLPHLDAAFPTDLLPVVRNFLASTAGAVSADILMADYDLLVLRRLPADMTAGILESLPVDDSAAGRAFINQDPITVVDGHEVHVYVPISLRAERLGVLDVTLAEAPDAHALATFEQLVIVLGFLLPAAHHYTDIVERARRERPLELPAEMQWSMLPIRAYSCGPFSLAGQLVPAYEVGGDLSTTRSRPMSCSSLDAMGHSLRASLLGTLAITALRNARRTGLALADQLRQADRVLHSQFGGEQFVTALAMRIDTGTAEVVNAGHPPSYSIRNGVITTLDVAPDGPLGMFESAQYVEQADQLLPGDRLVLVSDGLVEATDPVGEEYGEARLQGALLATAALPTGEAVRHMVRTIRDYQDDELRDDADGTPLSRRLARWR